MITIKKISRSTKWCSRWGVYTAGSNCGSTSQQELCHRRFKFSQLIFKFSKFILSSENLILNSQNLISSSNSRESVGFTITSLQVNEQRNAATGCSSSLSMSSSSSSSSISMSSSSSSSSMMIHHHTLNLLALKISSCKN